MIVWIAGALYAASIAGWAALGAYLCGRDDETRGAYVLIFSPIWPVAYPLGALLVWAWTSGERHR